MRAFGIDWVGITPENGRKLLLSVAFIAIVLGASWLLRTLAAARDRARQGHAAPGEVLDQAGASACSRRSC